MKTPQPHIETEQDKEFRTERQWSSFKGTLFSSLSQASFIGVLGMLVKITLDSIADKVSPIFSNPYALTAMGGFMAAGVAFTYFAQKEWTDVKYLEDNQLAHKNAECMQLEKAKAKAQELAEHPEHARSDGKPWLEVVAGKDVNPAHCATR
jgi:hypothetical protein